MIGQEVVRDYEHISERIESIIKSANTLKADKMVKKLKTLIPEFKSNNSMFESLDNKEEVISK